MGQPIISFIAAKWTDAWYQLSKEEQDSLMAKIRAHREEAGIHVKNVIVCRVLDVSWDWIVVDEYPDIETIQRLEDLDAEVNWRRYWEGTSVIGTRRQAS
jgi:hypothetical protein